MHLDPDPVMWGHLRRLAGDLGGDDVVREIVRAFLAELEPRLDELTAARDAGDDERLRRVAHTLKSTAMLVGAERISVAAAALEHGAGTPQVVREAARHDAPELRRVLAAAHGALL